MDILIILAQIALGVAIADLASGLIHWFEDTYGDPEWPIIGRFVIMPNIVHHDDPLAFTKGGYLQRNLPVFAIVTTFAAVFTVFGWLNAATITAMLVGSQANETHYWSHLPTRRIPLVIRWLQRAGLMLSPRHHWAHHRGRFDTYYCSVTNHLNPVLERIKFFRVVEGFIEGLFRIVPRDEKRAKRLVEEGEPAPLLRGRRALALARRTACALAWRWSRRLGTAFGLRALA